MTIESLRQHLNAIEAQSTLQSTLSNTVNQTVNDNSETSERDSYISSLDSQSTVMPSETYGNIMEMIKAAKQANGEYANAPTDEDFTNILSQLSANSDDYSSLTEEISSSSKSTQAESTSSTSTSSSGSSESEDDETITETVVGPDGSIYLKTTTTNSEGEESVTMTKIASY